MNVLDVTLIVALLMLVAAARFYGAIRLAFGGVGAALALFVGSIIAPSIAELFRSYTKASFVLLVFYVALVSVAAFLLQRIGKRIKYKYITTKLGSLDQVAKLPVAIAVFLVCTIIISNILPYIPLVQLQFQAQGSTVFRIYSRYLFDIVPQSIAAKTAPNQFKDLNKDYNMPGPLTFNYVREVAEYADMAEALAPSVVKIVGSGCVLMHNLAGMGSGFVVEDGYVITNAHVAMSQSMVYIRDHEGTYPATPLLIDEDLDIAVLYSRYIKQKPMQLETQKKTYLQEETGITMGYPLGGDLHVKLARLLPTSSYQQMPTRGTYGTDVFYQSIDGSVEGNSGGPVVQADGKVIGVVSNGLPSLGTTQIVKSSYAYELLQKAKKRFVSENTGSCEVFGRIEVK